MLAIEDVDRRGDGSGGPVRSEGGPERALARLVRLRRGRVRAAAILLVIALLVAAVVSIGLGSHAIAPTRTIDVLFGGLGDVDRDAIVIRHIRLPRLLAAGLVGAALAVCGVLMQGLFRNPLADPGILGVSSGAALAAAVVIVLGDRIFGATPFHALSLAAFLGAIVATSILAMVGRTGGRTDTGTVLLAGLAFAALANALLGLLIFVADDRQLRDLSFWTLGSFGGVSWEKFLFAAPFLAVPLAAVAMLGRALDALAFGEAEARHMGVRVERAKAVAIGVTALGVGASVALVGIVGFVGVVVPHVLRLAVGPAHRPLLWLSAIAGALLTVLADLVARTVVAPAELPIGVLTAIVGAPIFLHLVLKRRGGDPT